MSAKKAILILSTILLANVAAMAATQAQINAAINNGIAWLVTQQDPTGYWHGYSEDGDFPAASTGLALLKLEERAYESGYSPFDPCYPYEPNVVKGFAYLFSQMSIIGISPQPAGDPNISGDGKGVCIAGDSTYETGIAMMAIAASRAPNMVVNSPGSPVNGWTYKKVLQDMVDFMAFGQCDSGSGEGGWTYSYCNNGSCGADNSNSGYAVEGLGYAASPQYGFNCTIPQFMKNELKIWIKNIQTNGGSNDGGSGYNSGGDGADNILKTGNLIFQMTFVGIGPNDPNFQRALAYIGRNWDDSSFQDHGWGNPAYGSTPSYQAMYCAANGLWYSNINTIMVSGIQRDWYADFADALVNAQQPDGSWPADIMGWGELSAEWALLTLEMTTERGPIFITKADDVNTGDCVGPGREINYTIDYNYPAGPNMPVMNDVNIIDNLPNEVDFNSASGPNCVQPDSNTVVWNIGTLSPGESGFVTLKVNVKPCAKPGITTNECEIRSSGVLYGAARKNTTVCCWYIPVIYVDENATGSNDGTSWVNAYKYLQDALWDIPPAGCTEIWVAEGTYKPDRSSAEPNGSGDRTATFNLINKVAIYGGFPPGGGDWQSRNPDTYKTILSGDLKGNDRQNVDPCDLLNDPCRAENSYHVVTGSNTDRTAVLNGFTITGGNASDISYITYTYSLGGGMYNNSGSPTITNCTFSGNSADNGGGYGGGGGMYNEGGGPIVTNCTFSGNAAFGWIDYTGQNAHGGGGGGMFNYYSSPVVTNCTFSENSAIGFYPYGIGSGGGMYNKGGSPMVTNCTFSGNSARWRNITNGGSGGGMYTYYGGNVIITNCKFVGNIAYGGGIYYGQCLGGSGGGMYNEGNAIITNCIFTGNSARSGNGASGGNGGGLGGGMCNDGYSEVTNCTFSGNSAEEGYGGGICAGTRYMPLTQIANCILYNDTAFDGNEIALLESEYYGYGTTDVNYSDVKGGQEGVYGNSQWGPGNIDADPCFVRYGYWGDANDPNMYVEPNDPNAIWIDGNYRLLSGSPCIDAGDNNSVPPDYADLDNDGNTTERTPLDLDGFPRFIDDLCTTDTGNGTPPIVDMGAYEFLRSDINHDGTVNFLDFAIFASQWLDTNCGMCCGADLTCDGQVNWADLGEFVKWWLAGTAF
ncbi:MAG: right-handed parallel beta-helix repeat-containing protein [Sedimentisphaerales bacterium]|jgi:hypothetical protein